MRDRDEQSSLECLPWCPFMHTLHREVGSGLGGRFAHLGGFPTTHYLPITTQRERKRMINLRYRTKYSVSSIRREYMKNLKLIENKIR